MMVAGLSAAGAQQGAGGQAAPAISFQTSAADLGQLYPAGGAPLARAVRAFLDANSASLKPALDFIVALVPGLNSAQAGTIGEVLGSLAVSLTSRGDTASLVLVQQAVAALQSNAFVMAGYQRATGQNPETAGVGAGTGAGGTGGGTGGIGGGSANTGGGSGGGNSGFSPTGSNPLSGGNNGISQGTGGPGSALYGAVSPWR